MVHIYSRLYSPKSSHKGNGIVRLAGLCAWWFDWKVEILPEVISWEITFQSLQVVGLGSPHKRIEEETSLRVPQVATCRVGNSHVERSLGHFIYKRGIGPWARSRGWNAVIRSRAIRLCGSHSYWLITGIHYHSGTSSAWHRLISIWM